MTSQPALYNPYVGPRPFDTSEKDLFFGRDREARILLPLVITERLVLFYAQSGAGKSSLINARLIPALQERNFIVLPTGRVSGQREEAEQADNPFVYNLLLSLHQESDPADLEGISLAQMTIPEYLANLESQESDPENAVVGVAEFEASDDLLLVDAPHFGAPPIIHGVRPIALIIDQFEEIFITHPEKWQKRAEFFEQLCQAQTADPYLWVILVIREDYVARVDPYAHLLYGGLRARFYMKLMDRESALEAVKNPVCDTCPFDPGVAEELVDNLRRITAIEYGGVPQYGQYVEPVQLQVVCFQLWEQLKGEPGASITMADLNRLAKGSDLVQFISGVLASFYELAITNVVQALQNTPNQVSESELRNWFSSRLITETESRGLVFKGKEATGGLNNKAVRLLEQQFIIRTENRGESTWYELSHDRFVKPILQSNQQWFSKNSLPVDTAAEDWFNSGQLTTRLYDGRQLAEAAALLKNRPEALSDRTREFIQASQANAALRQKQRQRAVFAFFAALVLVLSGLTLFSFWQMNRANRQSEITQMQKITAEAASVLEAQQRIRADAASTQAIQQGKTAEAARVLEAQQRSLAETAGAKESGLRQAAEAARVTAEVAKDTELLAKATAVAAKGVAETASAMAATERDHAQAARLASLSDYFRNSQLDLSLLLAIQAMNTSSGWQPQKALFEGIQFRLGNQVSRTKFEMFLKSLPHSAAYSPDSSLVAVGGDGHVELWNIAAQSRVEPNPLDMDLEATTTIYSVAFDETGDLLARGGGDGQALIWNRRTNQVIKYAPAEKAPFPSVQAVAFQPGGNLLALATAASSDAPDGKVYFYNYQKNQSEGPPLICAANNCQVLAWSPDGSKLAVGSDIGELQIYDFVHKISVVRDERAHTAEITGLAWYPDGRRLVSGGLDGRLVQWDTITKNILNYKGYEDGWNYEALALSPDGRYLLTGVYANGARLVDNAPYRLWDAETLQEIKPISLTPLKQRVRVNAFNRQGNRFVTLIGSTSESEIFQSAFEPVKPLGPQIYNLHDTRYEDVFQRQDGKLVFVQKKASTNLILSIENAADPPVRIEIPLSNLAMAAIEKRLTLLLGDDQGYVHFLDPATGRPFRDKIKAANGDIRSLAISPDGRLLAVASCLTDLPCNQIALRDLTTNQPIKLKTDLPSLTLGIVSSMAFSPDGKTLALGTSPANIMFLNLETGKVAQAVTEGLSLHNVNLNVTSLAYSGDQNLLAAGFSDGRIALWEASSHDPIGEFFERANDEVTGLLFRKNAQTGQLNLISLTAAGDVRQWMVDSKDWIARACKMAHRNLTAEEKAKFDLPSGSAEVCP